MNIQKGNFLDSERWEGRAFFADWQRTAAGVIEVTDPATGAVIASVGVGGGADIRHAAAEARVAQKAWARMLPTERARILSKAADLLEQNGAELIPWIMRESGSIYPKAGIEIEHGALFMRHAASLATAPMGMLIPAMDNRTNYARRVPHGVVGVISPFNFPLVLSVRSIAAALAFGNAVVHKPDPRTPISGGIIIARIFEEAGLPKGVLQIVPGGADAGEAMCTDPNIAMISFTGSARGGSKVAEIAGKHFKKVQLELGGKNSLIVLDDADLDVAASNSAWGAFLHQGQICMATGLILVDEKIADALTTKLVAKASHLTAGDPSLNEVALGPIISDGQVEIIDEIVNDAVAKGAKLLVGGTHDGRFYAATVLSGVKPGMRAFEEEIFGPVACIATFSSEQEAIALTNNSDYGLAAGVISADIGRALRIAEELDVGMVHVNDQTVNGGPFAPFGGPRKSGNGTRIGGPADIEEFTTWKWISVKDAATPHPF
ncbi:benzaldehyde dehydrogenase [Sinorhizobium alkalisoli]|uniref:Benzaldehyde dehydrogenase n=1 Tax=Sinorhizobium alkalisoli TaxID=1752398 RepID=A0A1E3VGU6_9HYPH|nr:benzaldehyde dehydrogenase [Sinorhizobium alkalisoli]MCA1493896.1 benzaldehyde dehydrogenase [Ensifer sp. NBAIM29]MCG5478290.1 benzaldehyde dehydrogenase [Sinorhizobium alkalisoli]ODR92657.1 benzaldehyde dehydrogenase [Sinorhizobium alkalisoli]